MGRQLKSSNRIITETENAPNQDGHPAPPFLPSLTHFVHHYPDRRTPATLHLITTTEDFSMAYAKSKSAYDARVRMFVEELAESHRARFFEPVEKKFKTEQEAKKFRFDSYGYMNALAHERTSSRKGNNKTTDDTTEIVRDRDTSERAKQWMLSLQYNDAIALWVLTASPKTDMDDLATMMEEMNERRLRRLAHQGIMEDRLMMGGLTKEQLEVMDEVRQEAREERNIVDTRPGASLPEAEEFYRKIAEKKLNEAQRAFILAHLPSLPDPFIGFSTPAQLLTAVAHNLEITEDELTLRTGMLTYFTMVWEQAKILTGNITAAAVWSGVQG